jgi:hypothetical protein
VKRGARGAPGCSWWPTWYCGWREQRRELEVGERIRHAGPGWQREREGEGEVEWAGRVKVGLGKASWAAGPLG